LSWWGWCGDIRSTGDRVFPHSVGAAASAVPVNRCAGRWLGWLLAAASLSGAAGCGREPLASAPAHDGSSVTAPPGPTLTADAGVPAPDAAGQETDAGGAADGRGAPGAPPPLAYVRACDTGLTRAASYTLVPDGVQTAYHRCGELGEVARGVRLSRDGRRLAVIAAESVRLFDTATWREIARVAHAAEPVDAAAFSPDGRRLATVSSYIGQVALWDTSDGHSVAIFPGTVASPETSQLARGTGVAFSSDGRRIATSMGTIIDTATGSSTNVGNNVIRDGQNSDLWFTDDDSGLLARTMYHTGDSSVWTAIQRFDSATGALQAEAGALLSGDLTQSVGVGNQWNPQYYVVDISLPTLVTELSLPLSMIPSVDWQHTSVVALDYHGDLLALSNGTQLSIVETQHPDHQVALIPLPPGTVVVGVSPADELVASGPSGTIAWDWHSGQVRWAQPFAVRTISWSADGSLAVATGPGALFRMWRTDTGAVLCAPPGGPGVTDRVFSADGREVLVRYDDSTTELRRADLSDPRPVALAAVGTAKPVALANDGSAVAVWADQPVSPDAERIQRLEVRGLDGTLVGAGPEDTSYGIYGAALSPDLTRALYRSMTGLRLLDVGRGTTIASFDLGAGVLGFSADGTRFALGVTDGIATYSSADGTAGPVMRPAGQPVAGGALSADWSIALSLVATSDGKVPYPAQLVRWAPPDGPAQSLLPNDLGGGAILSTDGALIIRTDNVWHEFTGDYYDTIVRDAVTGALLQRFSDHPVTPSADGTRLFGNDGAVFCR
jgi:WD40 repeat protein